MQATQKQPASSDQNQSQNVPDKDKEKSFANSALWAAVTGVGVLIYHIYIAVAQPASITVFWYLAILPIILGIGGFKSEKRRVLAIAGIALGVIAIVVFLAAIMPNYQF